jgi:Tol biopolymer transport system component
VSIAVRREGVPRAALLLALLLLLVALVGAGIAVVGMPRPAPAPLAVTNGLIAFERDFDIFALRPGETEAIPLAVGPGEQGGATFSPDGSRMAYWSENLGAGFELTVTDLDGSDRRAITPALIRAGSAPTWSPDATRLAYATEVGGVFIAPLDGSGPVRVGDPDLIARPPAWSPDGSTIAFGASERSVPTIFRLYLIDADGSDLRQVGDVRGDGFAFIRVDWSPDGSKVVAQASAADDLEEWDIWTIPIDGSAPTNIGAHAGGDEIIPDYAPDREAIVWSHATPVLLEPGAEPIDLPATAGNRFSPDGRSLMGHRQETGIVVTDLAGNVQFAIPDATNVFDWQAVPAGD